MRVEKAAVLGAGTMGAQIAAHLANAGVPTLLLDIAPNELTAEEQAKGLALESKECRRLRLSAPLELFLSAQLTLLSPVTSYKRPEEKLLGVMSEIAGGAETK